MATIFVIGLSLIKVIRKKKNESILVFGIDGLISLWITTLVFLLFSLVGWFSAPNIKYEVIKYISYVLFIGTSVLHIIYVRTSKNKNLK